MKIVEKLASLIAANLNCTKSGNDEWAIKHRESIDSIMRAFAPSGSGIDCGTAISYSASKTDKLVFYTSFHHMNDSGTYYVWTEHKVIVRPGFSGPTVYVTGRNENDIKDYLADVFLAFLTFELQEPAKAVA